MDDNKSKERYEDYYSSVTSFMEASPGNRWIYSMLDDLFAKISPDSVNSILDVGCGEGSKSVFLKSRFRNASVLGIDFSASGIDIAKKRENESGLQFKLVDVSDESVWGEKYDLISAFELLEHIEDWKALIDKFAAQSSKFILLSFPVGRMRKYESKLGHVRNFKRKEVEAYLAIKNFKPVDVYYAGFPFFSPISRDMMNFFFKTQQEHIESVSEPTLLTKLYSKVLFFLFKYCSTKKHFGEQFLGLFINGDAII
ncbi:MAG: class I SAM-dependent methyltransferase [Oscillospiraceae bacterium]|nr:class I SAM-dependent methyltransferase [Oscillospiraceae bacterium]